MAIVDIMKIEPVTLTKGVVGVRNVPVDPQLDSVAAAGFYLQTRKNFVDEKCGFWREGGQMCLRDASVPNGISLGNLKAPHSASAGQTFLIGNKGPMLKSPDDGAHLQIRNPSDTDFVPLTAPLAPPPGSTKTAPIQLLEGFLTDDVKHGAIEFANGILTIGINGVRMQIVTAPLA